MDKFSIRDQLSAIFFFWTDQFRYVIFLKREVLLIARTKEFDKNQALHEAMLLFWKKGYEAASIPDLLEVMGISRSSLYDTFSDKQTLYRDALEHYKKGVPISRLFLNKHQT